MRILIQRVSEASVEIDFQIKASILKGLLVFVGVEDSDTKEDVDWLANKMVNLRIFNDNSGIMNLSVLDIEGDILLISQFTLHASAKKGNRPSYIKAARPEKAIPLYELMIKQLSELLKNKIETGTFGADMKISLVNDGPVTIWLDSKEKS